MSSVSFRILSGILFGVLCSPESKSQSLEFESFDVVNETDPRYLSVAIDTAQVVGGLWWENGGTAKNGKGTVRTKPFDFQRQRLIDLTQQLSPAYLRIGGTEADDVGYDLSLWSEPNTLSFQQWDSVHTFLQKVGMKLVFTVNYGRSSRDRQGHWNSFDFENLLSHFHRKAYPQPVWELGNEVNAYWLTQKGFRKPNGEAYAVDVMRARTLAQKAFGDTQFTGPGSAWWPVLGEPLSWIHGIHTQFMKTIRSQIDHVSYHYYPTQSSRCPIQIQRATENSVASLSVLSEFSKWTERVVKSRNTYAPDAQVWLSETGSSQCGGQIGISDRFVSSLWWADQLGLGARSGVQVMIRQTLSGSDYGLINDTTLEPNPDYWISVLWKRTMGTKVFSVKPLHRNLRTYAHCSTQRGSISSLIINIGEEIETITIPSEKGVNLHLLTAPYSLSRDVFLNGKKISSENLKGIRSGREIRIPPKSLAFATWESDESPCQ